MRNQLAVILLLMDILGAAHAQQAPEDFLYICDPKSSWAVLSVVTDRTEEEFVNQKKLRRVTERIAFPKLIRYMPEDKRGNIYRAGSSSIIRQCGVFTITVSGGFLNPDPNGELGAIEFPLIEIAVDGKKILPPISLGSCEKDIGRYNYQSTCPENWATKISTGWADWKKKPNPYFILEHTYDETRDVR